MNTPRVFLALLFTILAPFAFAAEPPAFAVTVNDGTVTVSNVTPGGAVVLFSCERGSLRSRTHVQPHAFTLHDEDGDGIISLRPERGVPPQSVWFAADLLTGAAATAAHPAFRMSVFAIADGAFKKDAEGAIAMLDQQWRGVLLLLVRPGSQRAGAWMLFTHDGGKADTDGVPNGRVALSFASARAVEGKDKAPKHLQAGDVVAAIDPSFLDVYIARVAK